MGKLIFLAVKLGKRPKKSQKMQFSKIGLKSTQKWHTLKTNVYFTILGGMLALKSGLRFLLRHLKTGTFGESAHFQVPKNGSWDAQI